MPKLTSTDKPPNFIRDWRKHRKLTQEQLAAQIGVATASISQLENGKQGFTDSTLYALSDALRASPADLLSRGPNETLVGRTIPIMGYLGAGAEVEPDYEQVPPEGLDQVTLPLLTDDDLIAFKVRGTSMLPFYKDGLIIVVYREQRKPIESFFGDEAAVRTSDGRRFIKTVMRGADRTVVNLISWNAPPMENVRLEWIGEIFGTLRP